MQGVPAVYLGRIVSKDHFRAFIYAPNGSQKLVESWDEYEQHMKSGLWFATPEESNKKNIQEEKLKRVQNKTVKSTKIIPVVELVDEKSFIEEEFIPIELKIVDMKKDDDFLPKEN